MTVRKNGRAIGIDLHKDNFVTCYLAPKKMIFRKFLFSNDGIQKFIKTLRPNDTAAVEATSNARYLVETINEKLRSVTVVPPTAFALIKNSTKKTDKNDAALLAMFLSKKMLPEARLKDPLREHILSLVYLREHLVRTRTKFLNIAHAVLLRNGIAVPKNKLKGINSWNQYVLGQSWHALLAIEFGMLSRQIADLNLNIGLLEKEIERAAISLRGYKNILTIKGIGALSAATLVSIIGEVTDFSSEAKLASYFGIVPSVRMSNGKKEYGRITKKGSKLGRTTLVQCTWVAIKFSPYLRKFYNRLKKRKGSKRAVIATARKLLSIIYNTMKNGWLFTDFPKFKYSDGHF